MEREKKLAEREREILGALALGLELRNFGDGWRFVGSRQDETVSGVPVAWIRGLIDDGFIVEHDCRAEITDAGASALLNATRSFMEQAVTWLTSRGLKQKTS